ncbi:MAG TPA: response regulator transcription factor [Chloroflexota bacterium]|nr:response regulator transcription factor [Chloroflexota bacterium]
MPRVLVVDDDLTVRNTVTRLLVGFGYEVHAVSDGETALMEALTDRYDLLILDLRLPKLGGIEVCRRVRLRSLVPILMLTAMGGEMDKVTGLETGADDYLTKPFSGLELLARVKALLRRSKSPMESGRGESQPSPWKIEIGRLTIDMIERQVTWKGKPIRLAPKEFDLLAHLARNPGVTFSARQLMMDVWGYPDSPDTRTVAVHIRWLREKLEADPAKPVLILTAKGGGYVIAASPQ